MVSYWLIGLFDNGDFGWYGLLFVKILFSLFSYRQDLIGSGPMVQNFLYSWIL